MKILDWKSFTIGALLTATIVLGTGASINPSTWDANQEWEFKIISMQKCQEFQKMMLERLLLLHI